MNARADRDDDQRAHLRSFQELVQRRVQRILLVSSLYDSFILSEEGRLQETLLSQFIDLNLQHVPDVTRTPSAKGALKRLKRSKDFDLVITSVNSGELDPVELKRELTAAGIYIPVLALAYSSRELAEFRAACDTSELDGLFLWQGDARIFLAMVKYAEDRLNVAHDTGKMGVPAILVVEDNVRFYSSFLPTIYSELFRHMHRLLSEDLNLSQKMLRIRARPKVLLCRNYEEAWSYFTSFDEQILGVISDIQFPREGRMDRRAGLELCSRVHKAHPDVRLVLQSSAESNRELAKEIRASFLLKGSPLLLHELRHVLVERFGFGDFVFRGADGSEVDRAENLKMLREKLETVPAAVVAYHAGRNHFSNWLKARTEFGLAERLRPQRVEDYDSFEDLQAHLVEMVGDYRRRRNLAVIADFDRRYYDGSTGITRIGEGSLGGKARGLAFANNLLQRSGFTDGLPEVDVHVPMAVVLATGVFEEFVEDSGIGDFAVHADSDQEVLQRILRQPLPASAVEDLRVFLKTADFPLAVRSSSLFEDSFAQPFAGVYTTYMLPNNHPSLEVRLARLVDAIKRVYASTFTVRAKSYLQMTSFRLEEEKMAVLIQRVVGRHHGDRFYPDFSGVARSYNFYPQPPCGPEEGVAAVALGMGRTVVDGSPCLRFCPRYPRHVIGFSSAAEALHNNQRSFFAIDMDLENGALGVEELKSFDLSVAEADGTLASIASTYIAADDRIADGMSRPGQRILTFAPVLKHRAFPLAELLTGLLDAGVRGTNSPVEIEFAGNFAGKDGRRAELAFLQLRPLAMSRETEAVRIEEEDEARALCSSSSVLGNGRVDDIRDVVVVGIDSFDRHKSGEVAQIVADFNLELSRADRPYLLIGVGRWGSADPYLGIPVSWNQIAGARVIVEAGFRDFRVEPSQGTHFFQNLTSSNVGYFTVNPDLGEGHVDWEWFAKAPAVREVEGVRHLRFDQPLQVRIDGREARGVILRPD